MNGKLLAIAVVLLCVAIFFAVRDPGRQTPQVERTDTDPGATADLPAWVQEPLPSPPPDFEFEAAPVEDLRLPGTPDPDDDYLRAARETLLEDFDRLVNGRPTERERERAEMLHRYLTDPNWPTRPAVPGVAGFDIRVCVEFRTCLSDTLAEEEDNAAWARPMESRIYSALAGQALDGLSQVHVVCRQATCGVLLPTSHATQRLNLWDVGSALEEALDFAAHETADRADFQAIYFTRSERR